MRSTDHALAAALADGGGVLRRSEHPNLRRTLDRRVRAGELVQLLPGVLVPSEHAGQLPVVVTAVRTWDPDAVLTGAVAARLGFWPDVLVSEVTLSSPTQLLPRWGAVQATRERLDPELVVQRDGLRLTCPALTALDLAPTHGGSGIDEALRRGACSLVDLHGALARSPRRPGNRLRRRLLHESRDEPWSPAERMLHRLLHEARVSGWRANSKIRCRGRVRYLDLAFRGEGVCVEVDGFEFHSARKQFHDDRRRWTDLQSEGWWIVHLTPDQVEHDPEWVLARIEQVREVARWSRGRR